MLTNKKTNSKNEPFANGYNYTFKRNHIKLTKDKTKCFVFIGNIN